MSKTFSDLCSQEVKSVCLTGGAYAASCVLRCAPLQTTRCTANTAIPKYQQRSDSVDVGDPMATPFASLFLEYHSWNHGVGQLLDARPGAYEVAVRKGDIAKLRVTPDAVIEGISLEPSTHEFGSDETAANKLHLSRA